MNPLEPHALDTSMPSTTEVFCPLCAKAFVSVGSRKDGLPVTFACAADVYPNDISKSDLPGSLRKRKMNHLTRCRKQEFADGTLPKSLYISCIAPLMPTKFRASGACQEERRLASRNHRAEMQKLYRRHYKAKLRARRHVDEGDKALVARAECAEAIVQSQKIALAKEVFDAEWRVTEVKLLREEVDRSDQKSLIEKHREMERRMSELKAETQLLREQVARGDAEDPAEVHLVDKLQVSKERLYWISMMEECSLAACSFVVEDEPWEGQKSFGEILREEGGYPSAADRDGESKSENIFLPLKISDLPSSAILEERARGCILGPQRMNEFVSEGTRVLEESRDAKKRSSAWSGMHKYGIHEDDTSLTALRLAVKRISSIMKGQERRQRAGRRDLREDLYVARWTLGPRSHKEAYREHDKMFGQLSVNGSGCGGHQLTQAGQYHVLKRLFSFPRKNRRVLEVGFALGYLICGCLAMGATKVVGLEVPMNAGVLRQVMEPHPQIILLPMDVLDLSPEDLIGGKYTTVMCLVGTEAVTRHVVGAFISSPFAAELVYLLPSASGVAREVWDLLEKSGCMLSKISVQLAGSRGVGGRTIVSAHKRLGSI